MYIVVEPSYRATDWYARLLQPIKLLARKKRISLSVAEEASMLDAGESCALVLGGSVAWVVETAIALQARGVHPILLNDLPEGALLGRFSRVRSDFHRLLLRIAAAKGARCALYGVNPHSVSDRARRAAFLSVFPDGAVVENHASLEDCFRAFCIQNAQEGFSQVICTNELTAVSLLCRLREGGMPIPEITVPACAPILSYFPEIRAVGVDPSSLASAAFAIVDCVRQSPDFIGVEITVDYAELSSDVAESARLFAGNTSADAFYKDEELVELMRLGQLFSEADDTDLTILRLLQSDCREIGEEAYLSDNGVKYRIKKMKRTCGVESKRELPPLLAKYGIKL